jgi:hypothetical protein
MLLSGGGSEDEPRCRSAGVGACRDAACVGGSEPPLRASAARANSSRIDILLPRICQ